MKHTPLALTLVVALVAALGQTASAGPALSGAACLTPHSEASLIRSVPPELPTIAKEQGATGVVRLEVRLTPSGQFVAAKVVNSSGNSWLDRAALASAAQSKYAPETQDCKAIGGAYWLTVDFNS